MIIILNGSQKEVAEGANLADLVAKLSSAPSGIAVAIDDEVVPRRSWDVTTLSEGACVEVLTAVQGG
jgi:sulfur carrier protein